MSFSHCWNADPWISCLAQLFSSLSCRGDLSRDTLLASVFNFSSSPSLLAEDLENTSNAVEDMFSRELSFSFSQLHVVAVFLVGKDSFFISTTEK